MNFRLYYAEDDGVIAELPENEGFEGLKVIGLLERLKADRIIDYTLVDVSRMSTEQRQEAYEAAVTCAVWNRYGIRKVFGTNKSSASFFGRGVPALLVCEGKRPVHVFPHEERGRVVTIRSYLETLLEGDTGGAELARSMDDLRATVGSVGTRTSELVREGRRR